MKDKVPWQEAEWRQREQWHRELAANLPGGAVFILDREFRYLLANGESLRATGHTPSDFEGRTLFEVTDPAQVVDFEKNLRQAMRGEPYFHEHSFLGRAFHSRGVPLRDETGHVYAVLVVSYDITERRKTEEAMHRSATETRLAHDQIARILESISDAFYAVDADFRFTYVNRKAEEWWGRPREDLIGRHYWTEFPTVIGTESYHRHVRTMQDREPAHFETLSPVLDRWVDVTIYPAADGGVAVYFRDITDRKKAAEALQEVNNELEARVRERTRELSAALFSLEAVLADRQDLLRRVVSTQEQERRRLSRELHDQTGQHLTGLALGLGTLRESHLAKASPDPDVTAQLEHLQRIAEQLARDLHRIAVELRPTAVDDLGLVPALQGYIDGWSASHGIAADFESSGLPGSGERDRLPEMVETTVYRVVQEALTNIARYARVGPNRATLVSVTLQQVGRHLVAAVEDDGPGFDIDVARHSGRLGIPGMTERAAACGGTLEIETAPGEGTTVYLRIPLMAEVPVSPLPAAGGEG